MAKTNTLSCVDRLPAFGGVADGEGLVAPLSVPVLLATDGGGETGPGPVGKGVVLAAVVVSDAESEDSSAASGNPGHAPGRGGKPGDVVTPGIVQDVPRLHGRPLEVTACPIPNGADETKKPSSTSEAEPSPKTIR